MKKVIRGQDLKEKMKEAIILLCDTVKSTLGPIGKNVIINEAELSPYITCDGVTIARNIESEDIILNTILELAKEASIETNEKVGDGTTTTLVLLEILFLEGLKLIEEGNNPLILKKELDKTILKVIAKIKKMSRKPTEEEIINIANISAKDIEIGKILNEAVKQVGENSIIIKEHDLDYTESIYLKGYFIETVIASPYFFINSEKIILNKAQVLLTSSELYDIEEINFLINETLIKPKDILIIAKDYETNFINQILDLNENKNLKIILLKSPSYGEEEYEILEDIKKISNSEKINYTKNLVFNLGYIEEIEIEKEVTKLKFQENAKINNYLEKLKERLQTKYAFESETKKKRLSMLKDGIVEIKVGASTKTERREKKMRYCDALCAIISASKGITPGSGLILYQISEELNDAHPNEKIMKKALREPLKQILENSALNSEEIISNIKKNNFQILYNVNTNSYENLTKTSVIDTTETIINAIKNASSIAGMLLTTDSLVVNERVKTNDNNEF